MPGQKDLFGNVLRPHLPKTPTPAASDSPPLAEPPPAEPPLAAAGVVAAAQAAALPGRDDLGPDDIEPPETALAPEIAPVTESAPLRAPSGQVRGSGGGGGGGG